MKRGFLIAGGVFALAGVAAVAYVSGLVPGTRGCVLRSVDKREYIAANEAVFRTIRVPQWLRERHANTWHHGITSPNSCLPVENGPPYDRYITTYVFLPEPGGRPVGFDVRVLGPEWIPVSIEESYRRGTASLHVDNTQDGVLLRIDHRGYAERLP